MGAFIRLNVCWVALAGQDFRDQIPTHLFDLAADLRVGIVFY